MKNLVKNRVRITHGRVLYTGKYGTPVMIVSVETVGTEKHQTSKNQISVCIFLKTTLPYSKAN